MRLNCKIIIVAIIIAIIQKKNVLGMRYGVGLTKPGNRYK